jgi:MscS family membrane protein
MELGLRAVVIECGLNGHSKGRTSVLLSRWVALGLCLLLLLPSLVLAASSTDDTGLNGYLLRPTDTTSPRATLRSFQETSREMVRMHRARLPPADVDRAVAKVPETLDLSGLPPTERVDQGVEHAALLLAILGRIALPPLAEIPDAAAVKASGLKRWTIPDTEITIALTEEGPDAGRFQFTWPSVEQLPEFYGLVKHLPAKPGSLTGFYEEWSYGPGPWVPTGWTANLPAFAYTVVWHQTVWQWLAACATVGLTVVVILLVYGLARRMDRIASTAFNRGHLARLAATLAAIALLQFAAAALDDAVNLTGRRLFLVNGVLHIARYSAVGWAIILGLEALGAAIIHLREARAGSVDAALIRVVVRLLAISVVLSLVIWVAQSFGVPVAPLLASLGVGGLAIALAVRPTLENVIGGFILFADKPVRVGDFCRHGDEVGTVEEIGLRSTKIRSLERSTVAIPNAEFSHMKLDNFAKRDMRLLKTVVQLRYETTPEQMRWILARLRELLLAHPMVTPEPARVRFVDFGAYSKDVEIFAYLRCQDQDTFLAIKEDICCESRTSFSRAAAASPSRRRRRTSPGTVASKRSGRIRPKRRSDGGERRAACPFPISRSTSVTGSWTRSTTRQGARPITSRLDPPSSGSGPWRCRPLRRRISSTCPRWWPSYGSEVRSPSTSSASSRRRPERCSRTMRAARMPT